ncbi:MAG TPA: cytochrome c oxidase assembly protein [Gaiellaceae bacterium]|nr:cytochrome c oxidase assembly protein [Gaiellaceae bacterium]
MRARPVTLGCGVALAVVVLVPPLDHWSRQSLAVHMLQHVVLMSFAPPLVVLGLPRLRVPVPPWAAWLAISVDMGVWHVPALYDAALRRPALHALEHASYLVLGVVFWSPVLRRGLADVWSLVYVTTGSVPGWILALVLTFAPRPLYPAYAQLAHRLGGISALSDQQAAAGVMVAFGSIPFAIAVFLTLYRWLGAEQRPLAA